MKILYITLLFPVLVWAACVTNTSQNVLEELVIKADMPKFLEGATITVKLKDGSESTVPAEKFKVVPRTQQIVVTKIETKEATTCNNGSKNRISAMGGTGFTGKMDKVQSGATTKVKPDYGAVGGLQYQYKLTDRFSLGVQGQTNGTGLVVLGIDF